MALSDRHAIGIAALACLAAAATLLPPEAREVSAPETSERPAAARWRHRIGDRVARERIAVRLQRVADSLLAVAATRAGSDSAGALTLLVDERLPAEARATVEERVRTRWPRLTPSGIPVVYAMLVSPDSLPHAGTLGARVLLPEETGDERCLVIHEASIRGHVLRLEASEQSSQRFWTQYRVPDVFGACRFYGAFGAPGAGIRDWLASEDWRYAELGDWTAPRAPLGTEGLRAARYVWEFNERSFVLSAEGERCLAGDHARCASTALGGGSIGRALRLVDRDRHWGIGERVWLADLARTAGPARFAAFWRSPLPPDQAFAREIGEPLGAYVHRWARSYYGDAQPRPVRASTVTRGLGFSALAVLLAMGVARRRRVGR